MRRTKEAFAATRETVGITQSMLARIMGVEVRSVKRWESHASDGYRPPEEAWEIIERAAEMQRSSVDAAITGVRKMEEERGRAPEGIDVSYWRTQEEYDEARGDGGDYRMANANARIIAFELERLGYEVEWHGGSTRPTE